MSRPIFVSSRWRGRDAIGALDHRSRNTLSRWYAIAAGSGAKRFGRRSLRPSRLSSAWRCNGGGWPPRSRLDSTVRKASSNVIRPRSKARSYRAFSAMPLRGSARRRVSAAHGMMWLAFKSSGSAIPESAQLERMPARAACAHSSKSRSGLPATPVPLPMAPPRARSA